MSSPAGFSDYTTIHLSLDELGVLLVRLHTGDGPLVFDMVAHAEWVQLWGEIADSTSTRIVILTGTGDAFMPPRTMPGGADRASLMTAQYWQRIMRESTDHIMKMLSIPVPVIVAINGPLRSHIEMAFLNDIVIATPDTTFQDLTHLPEQAIPTDSLHVLVPALIGRIRSSYFFYTNQLMDAEEAKRLGLVNEIVDREQLLPRAYQIARYILRQPAANLRYYRRMSTHEMRGKMHEMLELGLAVEGLAIFSADWTDWTADHEPLAPPPLPS